MRSGCKNSSRPASACASQAGAPGAGGRSRTPPQERPRPDEGLRSNSDGIPSACHPYLASNQMLQTSNSSVSSTPVSPPPLGWVKASSRVQAVQSKSRSTERFFLGQSTGCILSSALTQLVGHSGRHSNFVAGEMRGFLAAEARRGARRGYYAIRGRGRPWAEPRKIQLDGSSGAVAPCRLAADTDCHRRRRPSVSCSRPKFSSRRSWQREESQGQAPATPTPFLGFQDQARILGRLAVAVTDA